MNNKLNILLILTASSALPSYFLYKFTIESNNDANLLYKIAAYILAVSFITYFNCNKDKAIQGEWRIPEANLHVLELIGGWPGSLLAQKIYHHKISKGKYQIIFWLIVFIHNFIAFEYLNNWMVLKQLKTF